MAATKISWCDEVWNPVTGCTRVSSGCDHCFAFALHDKWYAANLRATRNLARNRDGTPAGARAEGYCSGPGMSIPFPAQYDIPFSKVQLFPDRLDQPLHWRKPRRVFVNSMGDLFHEDVPDEFISHVFAVMSMAPQHKFLILTKRAERMRDYLTEMAADPDAYVWAWAREASTVFLDGAEHPAPVETWPLPNVWLGVSVENQETVDERIPLLLQTPAAVRWISAEPLLAPVDLRPWIGDYMTTPVGQGVLRWVVVGGESGRNFRPMDHAWAQQIRDQCREAGISWYGKQDSGRRPGIVLPGELGEREFPR